MIGVVNAIPFKYHSINDNDTFYDTGIVFNNLVLIDDFTDVFFFANTA